VSDDARKKIARLESSQVIVTGITPSKQRIETAFLLPGADRHNRGDDIHRPR
jgi:hypothetical protein